MYLVAIVLTIGSFFAGAHYSEEVKSVSDTVAAVSQQTADNVIEAERLQRDGALTH